MTATAHTRPTKTARHRLSKIASARDTIAGFGHDTDIVGLTHGQFSLLDLIEATLEITGPAHLAVATWSAGLYDAHAAARFKADGRLLSVRFVMDSASQKRGQASTVDIADLFGVESIRTTRSHAKFAIVTNDTWRVVITSSMNLNLNPRVEQFEMTEDADRAAFFLAWVDELFDTVPAGPGRRADDRELPDTPGLDDVRPHLGIALGKVTIGRINE